MVVGRDGRPARGVAAVEALRVRVEAVDVDGAGAVDEVAALAGVVVRQRDGDAVRLVGRLELSKVFGALNRGLGILVV